MDTPTRTRPAPALARLTRIGGLHHLLSRDDRGDEHVHAYTAGEMEELFSAADGARLALGEPVVTVGRWGHRLTWIDMVAAARAVA